MTETRQCDESCSHFDELNLCCWQATEKGLCFNVEKGDYCHLGYVVDDDGEYEENEVEQK